MSAFLQEWRDLITWIQHMRAVICGEMLPRDLANCEALNVRHAEYYSEIRHREPQKNAFVAEVRPQIQSTSRSTLRFQGKKMISAGNALSQEIGVRVEQLEEGYAQLFAYW